MQNLHNHLIGKYHTYSRKIILLCQCPKKELSLNDEVTMPERKQYNQLLTTLPSILYPTFPSNYLHLTVLPFVSRKRNTIVLKRQINIYLRFLAIWSPPSCKNSWRIWQRPTRQLISIQLAEHNKYQQPFI